MESWSFKCNDFRIEQGLREVIARTVYTHMLCDKNAQSNRILLFLNYYLRREGEDMPSNGSLYQSEMFPAATKERCFL